MVGEFVCSENRKQVLIVMPKESAYDLKSMFLQDEYELELKKQIEFYRSCGYGIVCLSEDMLAVRLLHRDPEVVWVPTLSVVDKRFLFENAEDYPEAYKKLVEDDQHRLIIRESIQKYKPKNIQQFNGDEIAFKGDRFSTIQNRIRFVANKIIANSRVVVIFNANGNNFCNPKTAEIGDGRCITTVDVQMKMKYHYYGGALLTEEQLKEIVRSI